MYKIIGTDGKEYGPIDTAGLRAWISQGRAHAQSLIRPDGGQWQPLAAFPDFAPLVVAVPAAPVVTGAAAGAKDDGLSTIIPYRNPQALVAYYLGLFSIIPVLGLFLGIAALVLGIRGMGAARRHPEARGKVHAWVGIICGCLFGLMNALIVLGIIVGIMHGSRR